jgi:GTPase Era involved in 16S rRNA processing
MASLDNLLARATSLVPSPTAGQREILEKLSRLQARLEEGLLRVAVLGQFKRGKSMLLNALLGVPLLPVGVTPVTAIPTFIKAGPKTTARITFKDGKESLLISAEAEIPAILDQHISETENPRNRLGVESVELEVRSKFLDQGIVLVDTPGVGSTFLHNTQAAEAILTECDVAVLVVSTDPPITEAEVSYLGKVQELIPKIFFALNKVDLLDFREMGIAEHFLANVLKEQPTIAPPVRIYCISARQGLQAKQDKDPQALAASGIQHLEKVLAEEQKSDCLRHGTAAVDDSHWRIAFPKRARAQSAADPRRGSKGKGRHFRIERCLFRIRTANPVRFPIGRPKAAA